MISRVLPAFSSTMPNWKDPASERGVQMPVISIAEEVRRLQVATVRLCCQSG